MFDQNWSLWNKKWRFWSNILKYRLKNSKRGRVKPRSDIPWKFLVKYKSFIKQNSKLIIYSKLDRNQSKLAVCNLSYYLPTLFFEKEKKKSYIVLHKGRWRFFCRLKHILPVVRFPFPVKFLIRPLGVGLQLPAPLHQLPVWYVHQFGWLLLIFFFYEFFWLNWLKSKDWSIEKETTLTLYIKSGPKV